MSFDESRVGLGLELQKWLIEWGLGRVMVCVVVLVVVERNYSWNFDFTVQD